jgi:hypothetical protein
MAQKNTDHRESAGTLWPICCRATLRIFSLAGWAEMPGRIRTPIFRSAAGEPGNFVLGIRHRNGGLP